MSEYLRVNRSFLTITGKFQLWLRFNVAKFGSQFGRLPALIWTSSSVLFNHSLKEFFCQIDLDVTSKCGPHTIHKQSYVSCRACAVNLEYHMLQFVVTVPRCFDRSQPLLWPTFSVWCLTLFINPESVTVAQKPEMSVEGRGAEGGRQ